MGSSTVGKVSVSSGNTPQATDDSFDTLEDLLAYLDVMGNDTGGSGAELYSLSNEKTEEDGGTSDSDSIVAAGQIQTITTALGARASIVTSGENEGLIEYDTGALDFLAEGATAVDQFTYVIQLGNGTFSLAVVSVSVTGSNDAPVVTGAISTHASEDSAIFTIDMLEGASDVDNGAELSVANVAGLEQGVTFSGSTLTVDPADTAFQSLAAGDTREIIIEYDVVDEHGASVSQSATISITGTNDDPTVAGAVTAALNEDDPGISLDLLSGASDVDSGAILSIANLAGLEAGLTVSGSILSVDPSNAVFQTLGVGETRDIVVTYDVIDEHGASVPQSATISITGTNDAPIVSADLSTQDADIQHSGNVLANDSDIDAIDTLSVSAITTQGGVSGTVGSAFAGQYGSLTMNSDGSWTYLADQTNPSVYGLALGEEISEVFTYTADDGNGGTRESTLTVTVVGINTPPDAIDDTAGATEDGLVVTGNVSDNDIDPDPGASLAYVQLGEAVAGFILNDDGSWTFDPSDAAYQYLALGETVDVTVSYRVTDNNGASDTASLTITVTGTNDAPSVADLELQVGENGPVTAGNLLNLASDADSSDTLSIVAIDGAAANVGTGYVLPEGAILTVQSDGSFSLDPGGAYETLAEGEETAYTITYTVSDGTDEVTKSLEVKVTGANDDPTARDDAFTAYQEVDLTGDLFADNGFGADSDIDATDTLSVLAVDGVEASVGSRITLASGALLTVNADGTFTYDDNGAFALEANESATDSFTYTISDGHGGVSTATADLTVEGALPDPVVVMAGANDNQNSYIASGAYGINGTYYYNTPAPTIENGGTGGNGSDGIAALAIFEGETIHGDANNDTIYIRTTAYGQRGSAGGIGGSGGGAFYYARTGVGLEVDPLTDTYTYLDGGSGGQGGEGGEGGDATARSDGSTVSAFAGGDLVSIQAIATGGAGGTGGSGGWGGFAGDAGELLFQDASGAYRQMVYLQGQHGNGGLGGAGGEGGDAFASANYNNIDGSLAEDNLQIFAQAAGGAGGRGGQGGTGRGGFHEENESVTPDGADGAKGGDAIAQTIGNVLDGDQGHDLLQVFAYAWGGRGGQGGDSRSSATAYYEADPETHSSESFLYFGDAGNGGDGANAGSASILIDDNQLLGGSGADQIVIRAYSTAYLGGLGGTSSAGYNSDNSIAGSVGEDGHAGLSGTLDVAITNNVVSGGADNDRLTLFVTPTATAVEIQGNEFDGGDGYDTLYLDISVSAVVDLALGTIEIEGGLNTITGIETFYGSLSDDIFISSLDDETIAGRDGADLFQFALEGDDTILDFEAGSDTLDLSGLGVSFGDLDTNGDGFLSDGEGNDDIAISSHGTGIAISNADGALYLQGVTDLAQADVVIA